MLSNKGSRKGRKDNPQRPQKITRLRSLRVFSLRPLREPAFTADCLVLPTNLMTKTIRKWCNYSWNLF